MAAEGSLVKWPASPEETGNPARPGGKPEPDPVPELVEARSGH